MTKKEFEKQNNTRPLRLGMHTYSLHFFGLGGAWVFGKKSYLEQTLSLYKLMDLAVEWELDGFQITNVDILTTAEEDHFTTENLHKIAAYAKERGLFLEYNASFDAAGDKRLNCPLEDALRRGHDLGAELVKFSLDITRPHILYGSCMHEDVVRQLADRCDAFKAAIPLIEEYGMEIALENHTDTFADEILWLCNKINHPLVGTCVDTMNPLQVIENPYYAMERMLPTAKCIHFSDDTIVVNPLGVQNIGAPHGQGVMDCPLMIRQIRELSSLDKIIFENEIAYNYIGEPIEEAREREMAACIESIRYLRNDLKLGIRNR